jgi:hypothetical protein
MEIACKAVAVQSGDCECADKANDWRERKRMGTTVDEDWQIGLAKNNEVNRLLHDKQMRRDIRGQAGQNSRPAEERRRSEMARAD